MEKNMIFWIIQSTKQSLYTFVTTGQLSRMGYWKLMKRMKLFGLGDFNPSITLASPSIDYGDYKNLFGRFH